MNGRLPTHLLIAALMRRVNEAGGFAVVRASGDPQGGAVLALIEESGRMRAVERQIDLDDRESLVPAGPTDGDPHAIEDYWQRRRSRDPDLWVIELTVPHAERFVAETILR